VKLGVVCTATVVGGILFRGGTAGRWNLALREGVGATTQPHFTKPYKVSS